ncbi:MAG: sigma-70 family RNA polymerase sigma factor [Verrucomicrobia bacterium]|nr:sigma-70 family RNA polymerase sigma factor [Verrucomicrobiota bacterium]
MRRKAGGTRLSDAPHGAAARTWDGAAGSVAGLTELVTAHQAEVRRFVERALPNREDAADVYQQTLLQAYRRWPSFRGENFRAWLFTIARHLIVDHYRAQRRFTFVDVTQTGLWDSEPALQVPSEVVRLAFESRERLQLCLRCVTHRLPLHGQVALLLADFYGFTDKESAVAVRLSLPAFKKLLRKSRAHLRITALGVCPHVASGDCPLVRPTVVADNGPDSTGVSPVGAGAPKSPGPSPRKPKRDISAVLVTLRQELLDGLGLDHGADEARGPMI